MTSDHNSHTRHSSHATPTALSTNLDQLSLRGIDVDVDRVADHVRHRLAKVGADTEPNTVLAGVRSVRTSPGDVVTDLRDLYVACYWRLVGVVALVAGNRAEAEDVVQEAFVRLVPHWSKVSRYDDPEAWVRKVAFRLLSKRLRRTRNEAAALLRSRSVETAAGPSDHGVDVSRALAALPMTQRQVVVLHHLCDLPVEDVATELGIPVGTVKSRLSRARGALTPLLSEESNDHG